MPRNIIFIATSVALYYVLKCFCGKWDGTSSDQPNKIFSWISIALALGLMFGTPIWGNKIPGSYFERSHYEGMFYVNLFPKGQKVKSYRVPALIRASFESDTDYYDDHTYSWREYRIDYVIMPSGGKITFYNAGDYLKFGRKITLFDDHGRYWGVELTNIPAKE